MFHREIAALFWIFILFQNWGSCDHSWYNRDNEGNRHMRNNNVPASTQTEYKYKSVQTGSATVPYHGPSVYVGPDHNKTKSYLAKIDTTILTSSRRHSIKKNPLKQPFRKMCVKCPFNRTVIAQKRLDGVLINELPLALSCSTNQPFSKSIYEVKTLFGSKLFFVLPQGTHTFIGKVINKKTGTEELKCNLKYNVIVRKCRKYQLKNTKDLVVKCDLDNIWGSKCTFSCKNGALLSHQIPAVCSNDLVWSGDEPICYSGHKDFEENLFCDLPVPPANGKFSCEVNTIETYDHEPRTPNGSICRISCDKQYHMPQYLEDYSVFYCNSGKWNSTMLDFCQRNHPRLH